MSLKEWGDLHGEPPMSSREFWREEEAGAEYRRQGFILKLTANELDWLFNEIMQDALNRAEKDGPPSCAPHVRETIKRWRAEVADQGYRG